MVHLRSYLFYGKRNSSEASTILWLFFYFPTQAVSSEQIVFITFNRFKLILNKRFRVTRLKLKLKVLKRGHYILNRNIFLFHKSDDYLHYKNFIVNLWLIYM